MGHHGHASFYILCIQVFKIQYFWRDVNIFTEAKKEAIPVEKSNVCTIFSKSSHLAFSLVVVSQGFSV